jgi:N-succinyldiaminopimelate aminotransferase
VNPALKRLYAYPFERLRLLLADLIPQKPQINMGIGEPQHATPEFIKKALTENFAGLGKYPPTAGTPELKKAIADWHERRYQVRIDPQHVLPVSGTREALYSFGQAVLDPSAQPVVLMPNPFYQIYEGSAILNNAQPFYVPTPSHNGYLPDWSAVPGSLWPRVQLAFVCSPGNPTGAVLELRHWQEIFDLSDHYGFVIAADECYSEIYNGQPPIGALQAAKMLGRGHQRLVTFNSLSKRSSAPGLRSGFVAGDPEIIENLVLFRSYEGASPSIMVQQASAVAWNDEAHVEENRAKYRTKFDAAAKYVGEKTFPLDIKIPEAGFFVWARAKAGTDEGFARAAFEQQGITVLPGSYLGRETDNGNPGEGHVRLALVAEVDVCAKALARISQVQL